MKQKIVIHTRTQEQFSHVLEIFEKKGWVWRYGSKPLERKYYFSDYKEYTCLRYENRFTFANKGWYESEGYKVLSYEEFLEKERLSNSNGMMQQVRAEMFGLTDFNGIMKESFNNQINILFEIWELGGQNGC